MNNEIPRLSWRTSAGEFIKERRWAAYGEDDAEFGYVDYVVSQTGHIEFRAHVHGRSANRAYDLRAAKSIIFAAWKDKHKAAQGHPFPEVQAHMSRPILLGDPEAEVASSE